MNTPPHKPIDWLGILAGVVEEWGALERKPWDSDPDGTVAELILRPLDPAQPSITLELDAAGARQLSWELRRAIQLAQEAGRTDKLTDEIAAVLVEHVRAGGDAGALLAGCCAAAGQHFGSPDRLVTGRPGSWEAATVRDWATAYKPYLSTDPEQFARAVILTGHLIEMGERGLDGGDVVSQALGRAANQLGSLGALAGGSSIEQSLRNIGGQHAQVADGWPT